VVRVWFSRTSLCNRFTAVHGQRLQVVRHRTYGVYSEQALVSARAVLSGSRGDCEILFGHLTI